MMAEAGRQRTLVREVLLSQLAFAAVVGLIALACVWWVSNWVVRDNLDDWAMRWVGEMESLGAGFFVDPDDARFLELERYLSRFPEIEYVRYYDLDGTLRYTESAAQLPSQYPELSAPDFAGLLVAAGTPENFRLDSSREPLVRISQAVATESIVSANLMTARSLDDLETRSTVVGFVELGLDYSAYDRQLLGSMLAGSVFIVLSFLALLLVGRIELRRAVQPLADLQLPLKRIAEGKLDVVIPKSVYSEISAIGQALETALEKIRERDQHLRKLANTDALTGLTNRRHFMELLDERLLELAQNRDCGALLLLDLDQFKYVNDTHGHQAGDKVLAQISGRLRQVVRGDDLIGRFGGDEFLLFVSDVPEERATGIARKIMHDLREYPLAYDDISLDVHCSVGIALTTADSMVTSEDLLSQADFACRQAKSQGRNRSCLYRADAAEIESIRNDLEWQQKLKAALRSDGFALHYQPIMQLRDNSVLHYEVLIRLQDEDRLCFPDQFLPAAVRFGLMQEIDHWVIAAAFAALAEVHRERPNIRFSINLTGSTFQDGTLVEYVKLQLAEHKLDAASVVFEITEQVAIGSFTEAIPQIRQLRELGCEFAVDDFGTGYSSLSYLKRLPVQYIKIDGVFIQRLAVNRADQTIVRAIADIARILGKRTIAEYVGDEATMTLIREIGIDYAQGFHIGKAADSLQPASPDQSQRDQPRSGSGRVVSLPGLERRSRR